ncbi:MAG: TIGR04282 family arsenosugar biosynthesis glycosyltransferase [Acidimicrobiales bacterium]
MNLLVMAKAPVAGRSKTRLCPPCTPLEAAALAEAALADTLDAVAGAAGAAGARPVLALEGEPGRWLPPGYTVVAQRGRGFDERLANAWDDVGGPGFQIGMDTPQLTPPALEAAMRALGTAGTDAVIGLATDGGWWGIGLRRPDRRVFLGVPMSTATTGAIQLARLGDLGLSVALLAELRDVDRMDDARAVAAEAPATRFGAAVAALDLPALEGVAP